MNPRWMKLWRDLRAARGRLAMVVVAIAISLGAVGAILSAYAILTREIRANYLGTNPATAWIEVGEVSPELAAAARTRPGIADAEPGGFVNARVFVAGKGWIPLLIFVVPDFEALRLNRFGSEAGAWPPPPGTLLVERDVVELIGAGSGDTLTLQTADGATPRLQISGTVHDPGLAPAWQEQTVYAYATPETVAALGETPRQVLKVAAVGDAPTAVTDLALWLATQGVDVDEVRIPPVGQHPHQSQMTSILTLLLVFSVMAVVLSAVLTATMIDGLLAQQIRQIGIMKAIGARTRQIMGLYLTAVAALGAAAVVIALPVGLALGRGLAVIVAELLNLNLASQDVPAWVFVGEVALGLGAPTLLAALPIRRAARTTVRATLTDYGVSRDAFGARGLDAGLKRLTFLGRTFNLSLRNVFRKRGRLILTVGLLSAAGAMFLTGLNTRGAWEQYLAQAAADRRYDLEVRLREPADVERVRQALIAIAGVTRVETWDFAPAAPYRADGLDVVRTYPDGGHGSLSLRAAPDDTTLIATPMLSGRWLSGDVSGEVVLNQNAAALFPGANIGDPIRLTVDHRPVAFTLAGVVRQILTPATAYVTPETYAGALDLPGGQTATVRLQLDPNALAAGPDTTARIESALSATGIRTRLVIADVLLEDATSGHVFIFIVALVAMAGVMAVVGGLGLTSALGASVIERTREFGVLRAIGARSAIIQRNVVGEGLVIGALSGLLAVPAAVPLTYGVGALLGTLSFRVPLPLVVSPGALALWLVILTIGAVGASLVPARAAARLTVREALAYV